MSLFPEDDIIQMVDVIKPKRKSKSKRKVKSTSSGKKFENLLEEHLRQKYPEYDVKSQQKVGIRPKSKKRIKVDFIFNHDTIVSAKYQGVGGTAEEKIPQEKTILQYLCKTSNRFKRAYLVYHGDKFTLIKDYQSEEMREFYIDPFPDVTLISFDEFKELKIV